jgi:hypothetical protein
MANFSPTGQGDRAEHEGEVDCTAHRFMPPRTEHHPHKIYEWGHGIDHSRPGRLLMLANVECDLYLDQSTRPDATTRIRQAFRALAVGRY